jgi:hypothetical protein
MSENVTADIRKRLFRFLAALTISTETIIYAANRSTPLRLSSAPCDPKAG